MLTPGALEVVLGRLDVCPPVGLEALSVPVHAARAWLARKPAPEIADVEGRAAEPDEERRESPATGRPALLWRGDESRIVTPAELRPGMTLVVPSAYGGLADGCWDPASEAAVPDLGDRARWVQTRRATLRLHPALLDPAWPPVQVAGEDQEADEAERIEEWLGRMSAIALSEPWQRDVVAALGKGKSRRAAVWIEPVALTGEDDEPRLEPGYPALIGRASARRDGDVSTEDDGASHTGVAVSLTNHMQGVAAMAGDFGARCGLPAALAADVTLAARWHDAGKVDPRFQRMLHGGSAFRAEIATEPLAKSALVAADRAARRLARERAGYPRGARHELASLALLQKAPELLAAATDPDLVLHLVASHHGHCRPFAPAAADPQPVELALDTGAGIVKATSDHGLARLDSGVAERFHRLVERYGWFGLAWLEAILRLADHVRSADEQREKAS
jgi:CRISPR-associated endonuclease/helicase Cas3